MKKRVGAAALAILLTVMLVLPVYAVEREADHEPPIPQLMDSSDEMPEEPLEHLNQTDTSTETLPELSISPSDTVLDSNTEENEAVEAEDETNISPSMNSDDEMPEEFPEERPNQTDTSPETLPELSTVPSDTVLDSNTEENAADEAGNNTNISLPTDFSDEALEEKTEEHSIRPATPSSVLPDRPPALSKPSLPNPLLDDFGDLPIASASSARKPEILLGDISSEFPEFSAELLEDGIYCIFDHIPKGTDCIAIEYSVGGLTYRESWESSLLEDPIVPSDEPWEYLCMGNDTPVVEAFRQRAVNKIFIKARITIVTTDLCEDNCYEWTDEDWDRYWNDYDDYPEENDGDDYGWKYHEDCLETEQIETEPIVFSNNLEIPPPETPPPFTAEIQYYAYSGYKVVGSFPDIPPNVAQIVTVYSLDGENYVPVGNEWDLEYLGTEDEDNKYSLENQDCILKYDAPLKSFLADELDQFYVRLQITTDGGEVYDTEAVLFDSETVQLPDAPPFEPPGFSAELGEDGIYCTFDYIPEGTDHIAIECSMGGLTYMEYWESSSLGDLIEPSPDPWACLGVGRDELAVDAFLRKEVNKLFVKARITVAGEYECEDGCNEWTDEDWDQYWDDFEDYMQGNWEGEWKYHWDCQKTEEIETEIVVFSNDLEIPLPETPPPFTAEIQYSVYSGYQVVGSFHNIPANAAQIIAMYSLDGENYEQTGYQWNLDTLGTEDEHDKYNLENQECIDKNDDPLKSYLKNKLDQFYVRLQITTDDGDIYDTQAALFDRGTAQLLPETLSVFATFPGTMFDPFDMEPQFPRDGQYQMTVREDADAEDVKMLLPETLPVKVTFQEKDSSEFFTAGIVECDVQWKELPSFQLKAGEALILPDMVSKLEVPAGTEVETPHGKFLLPKTLTLGSVQTTGKLQLMLSAVGEDEPPQIFLADDTYMCDGSLALAFWQKPSGAASIKTYFSTEEGGERTEIGELLDLRDLNHNYWAEIYGYVPLLPLDDPLFLDIGEEHPLRIYVEITGGTFDGAQSELVWWCLKDNERPLEQPQEILEDDYPGNRGDAGSDAGKENDSSDNGGQRPDLPDEGDNGSGESSDQNTGLPPEQKKPPTDGIEKTMVTAPGLTEPTESLPPAENPSSQENFGQDKAQIRETTTPIGENVAAAFAPSPKSAPAMVPDEPDTEPGPMLLAPSGEHEDISSESSKLASDPAGVVKKPERSLHSLVAVTVTVMLLCGGITAIAAAQAGVAGSMGIFRKMWHALKKMRRR